MEKLMFNLYKFFAKKVNSPEALVDICFLRMNQSIIKSETICRVCYDESDGIRFYEFKKSPFSFNAYLISSNHKNLTNDYLSEYNYLYLKRINEKSRRNLKDFKLESGSVKKGGYTSKLTASMKQRFINYLSVFEVSREDEVDLDIILNTISKSLEQFELPNTRNFGTLLFMFDPNARSFMLAQEDNLIPAFDYIKRFKEDKNPLLSDTLEFDKSDFLYHVTTRFYKSKEKTFLFAALSDEDNSTDFFKDIVIYEVNNDISNLDFIVQSILFNWFECYGVPSYIYYDEIIISPNIMKFKKLGVNTINSYDKFKVALLGHVTQLLTCYLNHNGIYDYNKELDVLNYVCNFLKYCLNNEFDPITNIFGESNEDLYAIIRDYISLQNDNLDVETKEVEEEFNDSLDIDLIS